MKLEHKINIDILALVTSGTFDFIKLGQTKDWIIDNFANPDDFPEVYKYPIWLYGNIEFHFHEDKLFLIYSDYIDSLNGGESIELEKWIFNEPHKLSLAYVIENLNQQRIDFAVKNNTNGKLTSVTLRISKSGVIMGFSPAESATDDLTTLIECHRTVDSNQFILQSISLVQDEFI